MKQENEKCYLGCGFDADQSCDVCGKPTCNYHLIEDDDVFTCWECDEALRGVE